MVMPVPTPVSGRQSPWAALLVSGLLVSGLALILGGCGPRPVTWATYHNARFGYSLPYPSHWQATGVSNGDGQIWVYGRDPRFQARCWASLVAGEATALPPPNFTTAQGLRGYREEYPQRASTVYSLTLQQQGIRYRFIAQSPQAQFRAYRPAFEHMARQFRLEAGPRSP